MLPRRKLPRQGPQRDLGRPNALRFLSRDLVTSAKFNSQVLAQAYFCGSEIRERFINACR